MACIPSTRTDNKVNIIVTGLQDHQSIKTDGVSNCLPSVMYKGGGNVPMVMRSESFINKPHLVVYGNYNEAKKRYKAIREILCKLWEEIRKEKIQWNTRGFLCFQEKEILQPNLYENEFQGKMENGSITTTGECESKTINTGIQMQDLWEEQKLRYTSQRQEQIEQLFKEFDCALQELSYQRTSEERQMEQSSIQEEKKKSTGLLRRLTPRECFRLQGFLNDEINLDNLSDTQRYKLAGNGQDCNIVSLIFKNMLPLENTAISPKGL